MVSVASYIPTIPYDIFIYIKNKKDLQPLKQTWKSYI